MNILSKKVVVALKRAVGGLAARATNVCGEDLLSPRHWYPIDQEGPSASSGKPVVRGVVCVCVWWESAPSRQWLLLRLLSVWLTG